MVGASRHAGVPGLLTPAKTLQNTRRYDAQGGQPAPDFELPSTEGRAISLREFTGDGTFGGLLAAGTWPTTFGGPNGIWHLVGQLLRFPLAGIAFGT